MVVIGASIVSKSGKVLVSRQYVGEPPLRIETLLEAFPKMVPKGKPYTYIETEHLRYVYQHINALFLLLVTTKERNVLGDLDTLKMLYKCVHKHARSLNEKGIAKAAFKLTSAFDEVISPGHKENVTKDEANEFDPISTKAKDVKPTSQTRTAAPPRADPFTLTVEEKLNVALSRDGEISSFDVQGNLWLRILDEKDAFVKVQIERGGNPEILFTINPHINREMFTDKNILVLKRPDQPFPTGQGEGGDGYSLLRWRMQRADKSMVPLTINCCPSASGNETYITIKYEASSMFDLKNVIISVPLLARSDAPSVRQCDGDWRYDSRNSVLEWSIPLIDNSNHSGSMKIAVPLVAPSVFFPICVQFAATSTYSGLRVTEMIPLIGDGGGPTSSFTQRTQLIAQNYRVI